jgi:hypothetical protein
MLRRSERRRVCASCKAGLRRMALPAGRRAAYKTKRSHRPEGARVATGRYTSDLTVGDELGPVRYTMSRFIAREYAHANELHQPCFQGLDAPIAPPTLVHIDKLRLYKIACPEGAGPSARIHYEFDATVHEAVRLGTQVESRGKVVERFEKKGREYVVTEIEMRAADDGRLLIAYRDTVILSFKSRSAR